MLKAEPKIGLDQSGPVGNKDAWHRAAFCMIRSREQATDKQGAIENLSAGVEIRAMHPPRMIDPIVVGSPTEALSIATAARRMSERAQGRRRCSSPARRNGVCVDGTPGAAISHLSSYFVLDKPGLTA